MKCLTIFTAPFFILLGCKKLPSDKVVIVQNFDLGRCQTQFEYNDQARQGLLKNSNFELNAWESQFSCFVNDSIDFAQNVILVYSVGAFHTQNEFFVQVIDDSGNLRYRMIIYEKRKKLKISPAQYIRSVVVPRPPSGYFVEYEFVVL